MEKSCKINGTAYYMNFIDLGVRIIYKDNEAKIYSFHFETLKVAPSISLP